MSEHSNIEEMRNLPAEVVISGVSGRLPESDNITEFREHLMNGDDMATEDDRRWEPGELRCFTFNPSRVTWGVKLPPRAIFHL